MAIRGETEELVHIFQRDTFRFCKKSRGSGRSSTLADSDDGRRRTFEEQPNPTNHNHHPRPEEHIRPIPT